MSRKKRKKRHVGSTKQGRPALGNDELKMSDVVLKLAEPLLKRYGNSPQRFESIIVLTIAAWNKALLPADKQRPVEQELIDLVVPKDGSAEDVGAIVQVMDIIEERRKLLFPKLRKLVASYDLKFSDGRVSLNVGWAPVPPGHSDEPLPPKDGAASRGEAGASTDLDGDGPGGYRL